MEGWNITVWPVQGSAATGRKRGPVLLGASKARALALHYRMTVALDEDGVHGVDDFCAATVIECDGEDHAGVFGKGFGGFAGIFLNAFGEFIGAAEEAHADIIFLEERHLFADVFAEKLHKEFDFGFGAAPVLHG